jgi:hypothetical protein
MQTDGYYDEDGKRKLALIEAYLREIEQGR